ncbi:MAG: flagellar protein FlaG, partial [Desulfosporosinus sp.]
MNIEVFDLDIGAVKNPVDIGGAANQLRVNPVTQPVVNVPTVNTVDEADRFQIDEKDKNKPADLEKVTRMTEMMSKFVQAMDADIQFKIHEGTNQLMVQVVDQANNTVLKEFPPHEFLNTMAAIRD